MENNNVNQQITDAVTQTNVKVLPDAPPMAIGTVYQSMAQSTAILFQNAFSAQNQQNILSQASTTQGVIQVYSLNTVDDTED